MYYTSESGERKKNEIKFSIFIAIDISRMLAENVVQIRGRDRVTITNVLFYGRVKSQNNKNEMLSIWNIDDRTGKRFPHWLSHTFIFFSLYQYSVSSKQLNSSAHKHCFFLTVSIPSMPLICSVDGIKFYWLLYWNYFLRLDKAQA